MKALDQQEDRRGAPSPERQPLGLWQRLLRALAALGKTLLAGYRPERRYMRGGR